MNDKDRLAWLVGEIEKYEKERDEIVEKMQKMCEHQVVFGTCVPGGEGANDDITCVVCPECGKRDEGMEGCKLQVEAGKTIWFSEEDFNSYFPKDRIVILPEKEIKELSKKGERGCFAFLL